MAASGSYRLLTPAPRALLETALTDARAVFGQHAMSVGEVGRWIEINPNVVAVLTKGGSYAGYLDVLPLTGAGVSGVGDPSRSERELGHREICSPSEMRTCAAVYVASLVALGHGAPEGRVHARALFAGLSQYLERFYGPDPRTAWGLAATSDGLRVMQRFTGLLVQPASGRRDEMPLYRFELSPGRIRKILMASGEPLPEVELDTR